MNEFIRFVGLANNLGPLLATSHREGLTPLMTREETKHYAVQTVLRAAIIEDFVNKLGNLKHSIDDKINTCYCSNYKRGKSPS